MNTLNRNLSVIFCFIALFTGCSIQTSIKSVKSDSFVISGPPDKFVDAYETAQKECQKNTKNAEYIPDETASLGDVEFNCVGQEAEAEVTTTDEGGGTDTQTEADVGTTTETETNSSEEQN